VNFGWRCKEGRHPFLFEGGCEAAELVDPIVEYGRDQGAVVIGGFVYRGPDLPALQGRYLYADFATGRIWSIQRMEDGGFSQPRLELETGLQIASFGEDAAGELYIADFYGGTVRRLRAAVEP
jgi:hypothetical protein